MNARTFYVERLRLVNRSLFVVAIAVSFLFLPRSHAQDNVAKDTTESARLRLIETILKPGGIKSESVLRAIAATPRHEFVPLAVRDQAYLDRALPIGEAQTISSPFIVALMTEVLQTEKTDKVLEIGTGSGYQAAVLSPLVDHVYTIEIVEELAASTTKLLTRLGYKNITTKAGDGFQGWIEHAPFDKIIVTCSPDEPPQPLVDQLKDGGLMAIPVGSRYQQLLRVFRKQGDRLIPVYARPTLFVPMTGAAEARRKDRVDPAHPSLMNGDFEAEATGDFIPNWYYDFGAKLTSDSHALSGKKVVKFANETQGSPSILLQGLPLDGRVVTKLKFACDVTTSGVKIGAAWEEQPFLVLQFLDENRNQIGYNWLGPFVGDLAWQKSESTIAIPPESREAIVMLGLFGAVGSASFDNIEIKVLERTR
ncbi:MAG: protein-L-isoaspartate(D-aspartate) O-methyltransferase [Pirellulaceae bacterium]|nr:protein-L-isoaspartate(D-aspartate) O-methyltransferase [Pirellulaceae bacterium]